MPHVDWRHASYRESPQLISHGSDHLAVQFLKGRPAQAEASQGRYLTPLRTPNRDRKGAESLAASPPAHPGQDRFVLPRPRLAFSRDSASAPAPPFHTPLLADLVYMFAASVPDSYSVSISALCPTGTRLCQDSRSKQPSLSDIRQSPM